MKIELNGEARDGIATITDAVAAVSGAAPGHSDSRRGIAVALNGEVVPRSEWDRPLADGDAVEVLTATQGG
ncbi:MAG TPA: sulfur carrier protein ThiS [Glycomyces sp.]|nr:sulfur carrier protein ThiS [Glycomyces sp.]